MTEPTLAGIVLDNAVRFPDYTAYEMGGRTLTHLELRQRATALASALAARGLMQQDRIAILSKNSIEFGEVQAATQLSGIIMATVNFRLADTEILRVLQKTQPRVLFCELEYLERMLDLLPGVPEIEFVVCLDATTIPGAVHVRTVIAYEDLVAEGDAEVLPFRALPGHIACLIFTSGTTGASKACILGQRELTTALFIENTEMRVGPGDRLLIVMPMFHFGAIAMQGGAHARGATVVIMRAFEPEKVLDTIVKERINTLHLAPVMLQALLDVAEKRPGLLTGITTVVYAAAPMTTRTLSKAMSMMPAAGFLNLYGQTEGVVSGLPRELHSADGSERSLRRLRSIGFPNPNIDVRIVDEFDHDAPQGMPGEIIVRSEVMFRGYWNDDAASLKALRGGWQHTGDVGRFDSEGLLYLVDRKSDVIISGGENVFGPEVEEAILRLPSVASCAVVASPDEKWGETVCAVLVVRDGASLELEELQSEVRKSLAGYKVPRRLVLLPALPVLASGKVDKKALRALVAN